MTTGVGTMSLHGWIIKWLNIYSFISNNGPLQWVLPEIRGRNCVGCYYYSINVMLIYNFDGCQVLDAQDFDGLE